MQMFAFFGKGLLELTQKNNPGIWLIAVELEKDMKKRSSTAIMSCVVCDGPETKNSLCPQIQMIAFFDK